MFLMKINILFAILLDIVVQIQSLEKLPSVENNDIGTTDTKIRNTLNGLFEAFRIRDVEQKPKLKQFSSIHNYFSSITLTDCDNLKKLAALSRVGQIDNNTQHFITQLNEVLNENDNSNEAHNDVDVDTYIDTFIKKLQNLKEMHVSNNLSNVNADIMKYLEHDKNKFYATNDNSTNINEDNDSIVSDEFWRPNSGRRVYKGLRTNSNNFPFMASVLLFKKFHCAGSIIKRDLVITSASCLQIAYNNRFFREIPTLFSVNVGCTMYEGDGENIGVLEVYFHPKYSSTTLRNNLAIMRLERRIAFTSRHRKAKRIEIDRSPSQLPINTEKIIIVGWGAKDSRNKVYDVFRNQLSYAVLEYYSHKDCEEHYTKEFVSETNFCAGFYSEGSGACNRDAGGPAIVNGKLVGVVSFGSPVCGAADAPTVFTKLGYYADWIDKIMNQNVPMQVKRTTKRSTPWLYATGYKFKRPPFSFTPLVIKPVTVFTPPPHINELEGLRLAKEQQLKALLSEILENTKEDEVTEKNEQQIMVERKDAAPVVVTPASDTVLQILDYSDDDDTNNNGTVDVTTEINPQTVMEGYDKDDKREKNEPEPEIDNQSSVKGNSEDIFENDIKVLIDNLDIDTILKPLLEPNVSKVENVVKETSYEIGYNVTNKTPIVTDSSSDENKDDEEVGLSIERAANRSLYFQDLTLRENSKSISPDMLSDTGLLDLILLAIDEETKRLHKNKKYIL